MNRAQNNPAVTTPRAVGVAVETFDAWILADEKALGQCLGCPIDRQTDPETVRSPKDVVKKRMDAAASQINASDFYQQVLATIGLNVLTERCPQGFAIFAERVRNLRDNRAADHH